MIGLLHFDTAESCSEGPCDTIRGPLKWRKDKDEKYLKGKTKAYNALIINPALENPNEYFELTNWGELTIKDDLQGIAKTKAEETIKAINLNHNSLQDRRREMIQSVNDYKNGGLDSDMIIEFLTGSGFKSVIKYELEN